MLRIDDLPAEATTVRGFKQVFTRVGAGGVPVLLVHGWPESRRIWWRCIEPLAAAGFDVIAPDLRGFGDSEPGDAFGDVPAHARDLAALVRELGHERIVVVGGDLGGPVIQDMSLRFPELVDRMVLFNSPLPHDRERMQGMPFGGASEAHDYFVRQGTDADGLAAELATPEERRAYIATFHTSRFWAHPGAFTAAEVAFHTEPFADGTSLRASFRPYESVFDEACRSEPSAMATPNPTRTLILFGPSDHVISPAFDRMAEIVFPDHVGPFLLRDCGHFVQWEQAEVLVGAVTSFCGDLLAR
jgi:pimeloyl-ACP methyl ester carboxylesterase